MAVYTYRNKDVKPYTDLAIALAGGTPGAGGVPFVNSNPKAYIDAEITAAGGTPPGSGFVNADPAVYLIAAIATLAEVDPPDTTPPNTTITSGPSGTVSNNTPVFAFTSSEVGSRFEIRLDGGSWTPAESPWPFPELADGSHTVDVRAIDPAGNVDPSPASRTWTIDTVTFPPTGLTIHFQPDDSNDFTKLIENAAGASITDVTKDGQPAIRIAMPTASTANGDRCELASSSLSAGGVDPSSEAYYEWEFMVSAASEIINTKHGRGSLGQFHGNENAGFTGAWTINDDNELFIGVEGGRRLTSNDYEYETVLKVGDITRDTWHKLGYHVLWDMDYLIDGPTGFARAYLDEVLGAQVSNVPTMGDKATTGRLVGTGPTTSVMLRIGWYPDQISAAGLEMWVRNVKVYT